LPSSKALRFANFERRPNHREHGCRHQSRGLTSVTSRAQPQIHRWISSDRSGSPVRALRQHRERPPRYDHRPVSPTAPVTMRQEPYHPVQIWPRGRTVKTFLRRYITSSQPEAACSVLRLDM
jgi:hypothetical protein